MVFFCKRVLRLENMVQLFEKMTTIWNDMRIVVSISKILEKCCLVAKLSVYTAEHDLRKDPEKEAIQILPLAMYAQMAKFEV